MGDNTAQVIEIPPGKRQFEFRYTGLSLVSPDRVQFRQRLEGLNDDWSKAETQRSAEYSFLRPGIYRFSVVAELNGNGVWNDTGASVTLKILPPFYETWWFRAVVVDSGCGCGGGEPGGSFSGENYGASWSGWNGSAQWNANAHALRKISMTTSARV